MVLTKQVLIYFQIDVTCHAYHQHDELIEGSDDNFGRNDQANPKDVGHNIFILAHQVYKQSTCLSVFDLDLLTQ